MEYIYTLNDEQQKLLIDILDNLAFEVTNEGAAVIPDGRVAEFIQIYSIIRTGGKKKVGPCRTCGREREYLI